MKLVTNISPLLPPLTGIGHYTRNLLVELMKYEEIEDIKAASAVRWCDRQTLEQMLYEESMADEGEAPSNTPRTSILRMARHIPLARTAKRKLEKLQAGRRAKQVTDYIYWEPNYTLLPFNLPAAVTVHDLSHIHFPDYHPAERVKVLSKGLESSLNQASQIIAVSEYTKIDLVKQFAVDENKIDVVSPAVCDRFRQEFTPQQLTVLREKFKLPSDYILSVATLEPRKNIIGLVKAFSLLPAELRKQYPLVLVGTKGWLNEELERIIKPLIASGEVIRLGYISQNELPMIYAAATCLAYVSFFEGYGMPIAEAMAAGIPVVTSNISSMPEVAQGSALLADPNETMDIAANLERMLGDSGLRQQLAQQGRQISNEYTWANSAAKLHNVLKKVEAQS